METYNLIIAGTIGSVITLFLTANFDYLKEVYRAKIDERKIVFERKIEVAENAVSWFQESIDCYRMMQIACDEMSEESRQKNCRSIIRCLLCNPVIAVPDNPFLALGLGWDNRHYQDHQSDICPDYHQTLLLSSYHRQ